MSDIEPGTIIDGRYTVLSRIGSGGMADVYLAKDSMLGRQVAVKVLQRRFVEDEEFVERFRREASAAAGLSHPNVVAIFDRGTWNGTYYIAMEYLQGRTLKSLVREQGALDPATAIEIAIQILRAASFAHRRSIIHRDIKPHNVILGEEDRVTVTDFGIARAGASDMTHTGSIMGTAQYLSPEQAQGHPVSAASDIYAVGVLLYELLTGSVPFEGESAVAIALQHLSAQPTPPSAVNRSLPPALDEPVLRALAKDPAERYASAGEFIAALEATRAALGAGAGYPAAAAAVPAAAAGALAATAAPSAAALGGGRPYGPGQGRASAAGHDTGMLAALPGPPPPPVPFAIPAPEEPGEEPPWWRRRGWWLAGAAALAGVLALVLALELSPSRTEVTVPALAGQPEAVAVRMLKARGLVPRVRQSPSATVLAGTVISQLPQAGSIAQQESPVYLTVSGGPANVSVPGVSGSSESAALALLRARHLNPVVHMQPSGKVPAGHVISTLPSASTIVQQGAPVTVFVSSGPGGGRLVRVPNMTGLSQDQATEVLVAVGLVAGTITRRASSSATAGSVVSQSPTAGRSLNPGSAVSLVVAEAPRQATVPNVLRKRQAAAEAAIEAAGLTPASITRTVASPAEEGIVLEETPEGGAQAQKGATVTIVVGALGQTASTTTTSTTENGGGGAHP